MVGGCLRSVLGMVRVAGCVQRPACVSFLCCCMLRSGVRGGGLCGSRCCVGFVVLCG